VLVNSDVAALLGPFDEVDQFKVTEFVLSLKAVFVAPLKPTCPLTEGTGAVFLSILPYTILITPVASYSLI
jgi:hypothetical protein